MIKEAYCSFEVAKLLKERGIDVPCRTWYNTETSEPVFCNDVCNNFIDANLQYYKVSAPTHQMAMAWLREVHNIHVVPMIENNGNYISYLYDTKGNNVQGWDRRLSKTSYEEAVEAALKYVLENLI